MAVSRSRRIESGVPRRSAYPAGPPFPTREEDGRYYVTKYRRMKVLSGGFDQGTYKLVGDAELAPWALRPKETDGEKEAGFETTEELVHWHKDEH